MMYTKLLEKYGITGTAEGAGCRFEQYAAANGPASLLRREFLTELCERYKPGGNAVGRIFAALDELEADKDLLLLSNFFVNDISVARKRLDDDDYNVRPPARGMQDAPMYPFLLLAACIEPSLHKISETGMPGEMYRDIPYYPIGNYMERLRRGDREIVTDFPWDMNFCTCSLFRIDRFNFIPFRLDDDIEVYRRGDETIAFYAETVKVRRDGQLDGVNRHFDSEAFEAKLIKEDGKLTGHPILPAGVISEKTVTIDLSQWTLVLKQGDILMGFHIPGGEGYDPGHMRENSIAAIELFEKYFPHFDIKGIGSESWLYDPHIARLLGGKGNIPQMQQQMYIYPITSGDGMMWTILLGGEKPLKDAPRDTRLQRAACEYMEKGGRLTASSFFILKEDLTRVGTGPYAPKEEYERIWSRL